jgi:mannose-1-phosphate guanylyltransferase
MTKQASRGVSSSFHVILLAGGSGTRFWPMSRVGAPKQFLELTSRQPLLVETWRRVRRLAPAGRIWVVAPRSLVGEVRRLLPRLRPRNLIAEPSPRDTAPAIGLACAKLAALDPTAVAAVFPTDHVIRNVGAFVATVRAAVRTARRGALVCLGVEPDRPATGFGYLRCASRATGTRSVAVERFVEKPDLARARRYLGSGRYLWNAGMFVWRVDRFLEELRRTAPGVWAAIHRTLAGDPGAWSRAAKQSVDYAVMERASHVRVVALRAGWDDVGSWGAAARLRQEAGLTDRGHILRGSPGSAVYGGGRLVALVGTPGLTVVDTPDALLVVAHDRSEEVREVVRELRRRGRVDLL